MRKKKLSSSRFTWGDGHQTAQEINNELNERTAREKTKQDNIKKWLACYQHDNVTLPKYILWDNEKNAGIVPSTEWQMLYDSLQDAYRQKPVIYSSIFPLSTDDVAILSYPSMNQVDRMIEMGFDYNKENYFAYKSICEKIAEYTRKLDNDFDYSKLYIVVNVEKYFTPLEMKARELNQTHFRM